MYRMLACVWLASCALAGLLIVGIDTRPAAAQFLCDSTTPGGASGASAGTNAVACGSAATASGQLSSAFGFGSTANASFSTANGANSFASGASSVAVGSQAFATGNFSSAVGAGSFASGASSSAFGVNSQATADQATAIGTGSRAEFVNSAALGSGAMATRANQQMFGTTSNTYTLAGVTSAASRAAQTGPTQFVTSDSSGNLASASAADMGLATTADIATVNARLDQLSGRVDRAYTGVAMAFAMAGAPSLLPSERFAVTANFGTFEGRNGTAFSAAFRLAQNVQLNGGFAVGLNDSVAGGRVGLRVGW